MNKPVKRTFTLEFKQDAAQLVLAKGYSITNAATSLGVSESALRRWVSAERITATVASSSTSSSAKKTLTLQEHEELLHLRKENARLKMEREILKKASAFFAQEMK